MFVFLDDCHLLPVSWPKRLLLADFGISAQISATITGNAKTMIGTTYWSMYIWFSSCFQYTCLCNPVYHNTSQSVIVTIMNSCCSNWLSTFFQSGTRDNERILQSQSECLRYKEAILLFLIMISYSFIEDRCVVTWNYRNRNGGGWSSKLSHETVSGWIIIRWNNITSLTLRSINQKILPLYRCVNCHSWYWNCPKTPRRHWRNRRNTLVNSLTLSKFASRSKLHKDQIPKIW